MKTSKSGKICHVDDRANDREDSRIEPDCLDDDDGGLETTTMSFSERT